MNPEQLKQLLQQLTQAFEMLRSSGEYIPDEFYAATAEVMNLILDRIGQGILATPPEPPITQAMPSSNVEGFSYDDKNNRLFVRFLDDYPNRNGPVYAYENVPPVIFNLFRHGSIPARTNGKNRWGSWWKGKVPSIGASLYSLIKTQGYDYRRVA